MNRKFCLSLLLVLHLFSKATAQNIVYSDNFETPQTWTIFEELVSAHPCYGDNIGEVAPSTDYAHGGTKGLRVWANKNATVKSNHVIAAHHINNSEGITGQLRYSMWVYCGTNLDSTQSSPEFSIQSTRTVGGQNYTYIAGIQYIGNKWIEGKWNIWHNGKWETIKITEFDVKLNDSTWYYLELNFDMTNNNYLSLKIKGDTLNKTLDLSKHFVAATSGFKIGPETRNWTPSYFVTLESENLWSDCKQVKDNKVYYDDLQLERIAQVNYTPSTADIANPERGFYHHTETFSTTYDPLSNNSNLANLRSGYTSSGATYSAKMSLVLRVFYLESFKNSNISTAYLNNMAADFTTLRAAGLKAIVRFAYTQKSTIPYGDATKSRILSHITQLSSVLNANKDVIAAVQMGFIGAYGEHYYTDYFGDASLTPYTLSTTNFQDRIDVLNALLNALPTDRMVQVRTPQLKQKRDGGVSAPTTTAASFGRIGHHNDCFLATYNDQGTYGNYATGLDDTARLKPYLATDSEQVVVGGETCELNPDHSKCTANGGVADLELQRFHYSYLNADFNHAVNNSWTSCMAAIKNGLGYRFELVNGIFPNVASAGGSLSVQFSLKNVGFAAPFNPRPVELILRNTATSAKYLAKVNANPRTWYPSGTAYTVSEIFCLPASLPSGNYELLLNLPDPSTSLYARPEYAIQCANTGTWESSTGYNKLGQTITVSGSGTCSGYTAFSTTSQVLPVELLDFKGIAEKQGNQLSWLFGNTKDLKDVEILKSKNGQNFTPLSILAKNALNFTDTNPFNQTYYQLKINELDGISKLSKVILIERAQPTIVKVSPTLTTGNLTIEGAESFEIVNTLGQIVLSSSPKINHSPLSIHHYSLSIHHLQSGFYLVRGVDTEGGVFSQKIVKQ